MKLLPNMLLIMISLVFVLVELVILSCFMPYLLSSFSNSFLLALGCDDEVSKGWTTSMMSSATSSHFVTMSYFVKL